MLIIADQPFVYIGLWVPQWVTWSILTKKKVKCVDVCGVCFTLPIWGSLLMVSHVWTKLFLNLQHPFHDTGSVDWIEIISIDCCLSTGCCATKSMVDLVVLKKRKKRISCSQTPSSTWCLGIQVTPFSVHQDWTLGHWNGVEVWFWWSYITWLYVPIFTRTSCSSIYMCMLYII